MTYSGGFGQPLNIQPYINRLGTNTSTSTAYLQPMLDVPMLVGAGPLECTSETALAVSPEVVWDANGYYRALGFRWWAYQGWLTRKQLRLAFQRVGGSNDPWLRSAMTILLNDKDRRIYDNLKLGELFLDVTVQDEYKRRAQREALRRRGQHQGRDTRDEVLEEWGLHAKPAGDQPEGESDEAPEEEPAPELSEPDDIPWRWTYYRWRTFCDDTERLARWQELLVAALAEVGTKLRFGVGFVGRQPHQFSTGVMNGRIRVFFLNDRIEPTPELAAQAVVIVQPKEIEHGIRTA